MSIAYDFKKLPRRAGDEPGTVRLYPQAVKSRTVTFRQLAEEIEEATSYTVADLKGMMEAVADAASRHLNASEHVELEGLGTLSLSIIANLLAKLYIVLTSYDKETSNHKRLSL